MKPMTFTVTEAMFTKVKAWGLAHAETCVWRPDSFGSLYSYLFTPSGIGDSAKVKCPCGAELDITDYGACN